MKPRSLFCCENLISISVIAILLISPITVFRINVASSSPNTYFFVDPPEVMDVQPGNTFSIRINVSEALPTYSWEFYLDWDRTLLNVSGIKEGDFLHRWEQDPFDPNVWHPKYPTSFAYTPLNESNDEGEMLIYCTLVGNLPVSEWATGNGWLATLNFTVKDRGRSFLNLNNTRLWDHIDDTGYPASTYYDNVDGFFSNFHEIAVTRVTATPTEVTIPNPVSINVTIKNEGDFSENFNVTAYYDSIPIEKRADITLNSGANTTLSLQWNTTFVAAGTYTIKAEANTVPSEANTTNNIFINGNIIVNLPPDYPVANFTSFPEKPLVGELVAFSSTSFDKDGYIVSWEWDFNNDGTIDETAENPTWAFMQPGQYAVKLIVTDNETLSSGIQKLITIYAAPAASFTYSPPNPLINGIVTFDASASYDPDGAIVDYSWGFGDAQTGNGKIVSHAYASFGSYTVTLNVTDNDGFKGTKSLEVHVIKGPAASFTFTPFSPLAFQTITFNASSSTPNGGSISRYFWDFGDDSFANETDSITSHSYTPADTYTVTLTVTDSEGLTGTATQFIVVGKLSSTTSINVAPPSITRGERVTIMGSIIPERKGVTVTILYRLSGADAWALLDTKITNDNSQYSHDWAPTAAGAYEVKARWEGDANTVGDESDIKTITVQEASTMPDATWFVIAGIIIVIAVAATVYFLKFRK